MLLESSLNQAAMAGLGHNLFQLIVLANLEAINAEYIKSGMSQGERLQKLHQTAGS